MISSQEPLQAKDPRVAWMAMKTMARAFLVCVLAVAAFAQIPEKFSNLQVFPKDIPKKDLVNTMRGFSFELGVRCEYCHEQSADKKINFAADTKPEKASARAMLRMVHDINQQYIAKLGTEKTTEVRCVTCHRGLPHPVPIDQVLMATIKKQDVNAAIAKYKDLREHYYGGAQYDFGPVPLNRLTEALLEQERGKDAAAIMEMNVAQNPPAGINAGWTNHLLAMSHQAAGDTEKAKADLQKIVAANPNDDWAKKELEKLEKK